MTRPAPKAYDQDTEDLVRWKLKLHARHILMLLAYRQKKERVFYEVPLMLPTPDIDDALIHQVQKYRYVPVMIQGDEGEASAIKRAAKFRVVNCTRNRIGKSVKPEVWFSNKSQRASFHKVQVCGSVWTCPTCARKINMQRQKLIATSYQLLLDKAPVVDGKRQADALMITFTIKHGSGDQLGALLGSMKQADRHMQQLRPYRAITGKKGAYDYMGRIAATEITYGDSGWHPHSHQLWFFGTHITDTQIESIRATLFKEWKSACLAQGLPAPAEFTPDQAAGVRAPGNGLGVDVRRALTAAEYMTKTGSMDKTPSRKWSAEKELASTHVKRARKSGRSPFQLLFDSMEGDERAGDLFRIYAEATLGRHQLEFSKGLRKILEEQGLSELLEEDEKLAAKLEDSDESDLLGELDTHDFDRLCHAEKLGELNPFGDFLYKCKHEGFDAAVRWIRSIGKTTPPPDPKKRPTPHEKFVKVLADMAHLESTPEGRVLHRKVKAGEVTFQEAVQQHEILHPKPGKKNE